MKVQRLNQIRQAALNIRYVAQVEAESQNLDILKSKGGDAERISSIYPQRLCVGWDDGCNGGKIHRSRPHVHSVDGTGLREA